MSRRHSGKYSAKHPAGTSVDKTIMQAVASKLKGGQIACKSAATIAADLGVPMSQVGIAIDLLEGRITACQLGLFGYGDRKKPACEPVEVGEDLKSVILSTLEDGRIKCRSAWEIADTKGIRRLDVSRACESLAIRVIQCQLGAF